ncbi:MerR family transcriptional regulator [Candidatus Cetobacterium colombiensis]|uniref:MerR family transcriptional regulator n=1 Tax=Candidatus Cetobacterium colombiensis TaxID=3073100 RepID=A0ABU4WBG6_9FUSO|nr:MerR family transcriptional regulator [Candidatus Cetobacterium colombiensis]MDX8335813.1 MerR family transcriptional regulator [Candidatus Cetobacterium colombiensis]
MYTIKDVSEIVGLSSYTLRYYDKCGLMPYVARKKNGIRSFSQDDIFWIEIIKCLKKTGMTIEDIKTIVDLSLEGDHTKEERKQILLEHRKKILEQIEDLNNNLKKLDSKIAWYENNSISCK